jgi:hypothetical protein
MLSERDRRVLESIEADLFSADRQFVVGMRLGRPRPPREYRSIGTILLLVLGLIAFGVVLVTAHPLAVIVLVATAIGGLVRFVFRRLDAP